MCNVLLFGQSRLQMPELALYDREPAFHLGANSCIDVFEPANHSPIGLYLPIVESLPGRMSTCQFALMSCISWLLTTSW